MEKRLRISSLLFGLIMGIGIVTTFLVPDAKDFQRPELARIIFYHVPCALASAFFELAAGWFGFQYLRTRKQKWDFRCGAALEMSLLLSGLTLLTGSLFSYVQWGAWWQWDPRQTSYLMLFFLLAAGLALRSSFTDEKTRANASSAYSIFTLIPAIFLIFVFPRLGIIQQTSLHPSQTLQQGLLDFSYSWILRGMVFLILCVCMMIYRLRVQVEEIRFTLEEQHDY